MKSNKIKSILQNEILRKDKIYKENRRKKEIVLEQDLRYRFSCIIEKLGLLENQLKIDAELDSKN